MQIGASLLKFSRTEDDLQFWVLFKFLCSSSSLICNIALCSVGEDLMSCTAVWFGVCVVHSFTIAQTQSERERERVRMIAIKNLQKWRSISMIPLNNLIARCDVVCIPGLLHNGPDTLEELLDRHLAKEQKPTLDDDEPSC